MTVRILGSGCANCVTLERVTREALAELGAIADIEKVTEPADIASWGVLRTPGLVVDDEVVLSGRVPTREQVVELLRPHVNAG